MATVASQESPSSVLGFNGVEIKIRTPIRKDIASAASTPVASGGSDRDAPAPVTLASVGSDDLVEREVSYASGATELFLAIEESNWEDSVRICRERPEQAAIWIRSSGTEKTSFEWSIWRRLPIHEACRRQPPPILISALLDALPESSYLRTHFGELPLHLAVGCGASPESIHLLLASNHSAVESIDDAGRNPFDLVHEGVMPEDRAVILGSLGRCLEAKRRMENMWQARLDKMAKAHACELDKLARDHRKNLAVKDMALTELAREVQSGIDRLNAAGVEADEREREIQRHIRAERGLADQIRTAEEEVSRLRAANRELKVKISELEGSALKQENTIERLNGQVNDLSNDLRKVCATQDELVQYDVVLVEQELVKMIRTQKEFLQRVRSQSDNMRTIMAERDVEAPPPPMITIRSDTDSSSDEESSDDREQPSTSEA